MPSKHTDTQKQAAVEHARNLITNDGLTANQAAKAAAHKAGVTRSTLYRWANNLNVDLGETGRTATQKATAANQARYEERRSQVRLGFLEDLEWLRRRLREPHYEYKSAGREVVKVTYEQAPDSAVRNYVWSAAVLLDKMRLEEGKATSRVAGLPALADVEAMIAEAEAAKADG